MLYLHFFIIAVTARNIIDDEPCDVDYFTCINDECIHQSWVCDGEPDCHSGEDELGCSAKCEAGFHTCANKHCVNSKFKCDGLDDCGDFSDEVSCVAGNQTDIPLCKPGEFKCLEQPSCVGLDAVCDEDEDCMDGSDEKHCKVSCKSNEFLCDEGTYCINNVHLCDGVRDCVDGTDEKDCRNKTNCHQKNAFTCDDQSECVPVNKVCDGEVDCVDGSDEKHNCSLLCDRLNCEQGCTVEHEEVGCVCRKGFTLNPGDNKTCLDIDECVAPTRPCSQTCHNNIGSYHCSCISGYELTRTGKCKSLGKEPMLIYMSHDMIRSFTLKSHYHDVVVDHVNTVHALAMDVRNQRLFWSETGKEHPGIYSTDPYRPRDSRTVVMSHGPMHPGGLAFDHIEKNLYISDTLRPAIFACKHEISACVTVFNRSVVTSPTAITLYSEERLMYWVESGHVPVVMRGSMDGKSSTTFMTSGLVSPSSLFFDLTSKRLFWTDDILNDIQSIRFDGTDRQTVVRRKISTPSSLLIFEDRVFWANVGTHTIMAANKFTGQEVKVLIKASHPGAMILYHSSLQPDYGGTACWHKHCSHLCLSGVNGSVSCACPDGHRLENSTCHKMKTTPFLLAAQKTEIISLPLVEAGEVEVTSLHTYSMTNIYLTAYLSQSHQIIYSDITEGHTSIKLLTSLDTYPESEEILMNLASVESLAVDESASVIYWLDEDKDIVQLTSYDGTKRATINIVGIQQLLAIALAPQHGLLFVSAQSEPPKLIRCHQDGQHCSRLVSTDLSYPSYLVAYRDRLYWSDFFLGAISSVDFHGRDRKTHAITRGKPLSIAVHEDLLYWTELQASCVFYVKLGGSSRASRLETYRYQLTGLVVAIPNSDLKTSCSTTNGGCEHICIPTPYNVTCVCSQGFVLQHNGKSCKKVEAAPCTQHLCGDHRTCISQKSLCDRLIDCPDASDEANCSDHLSCTSYQFSCKNGRCINRHFMCDRDDDCGDSSDEHASICPDLHCSSDEFTCTDKHCIAKELVCNKQPDCPDGSDEHQCDVHCQDDEYECQSQCVDVHWLCDGDWDCAEGEDEINCTSLGCDVEEFQCWNGSCIEHRLICDGTQHCQSGEDESYCNNKVSEHAEYCEDGFVCSTGECIELGWVCDGASDCRDGSDESFCKVTCRTFNPCSQLCVNTKKGPTCKCREGFYLTKDVLCEDIDECSERNGGCSQHCENTKGSFHCLCEDHYQLGINLKSCKASGSRPSLFIGSSNGLHNVTLDGKGDVFLETKYPIRQFDINIQSGHVFWATQKDRRSNMTFYSSLGFEMTLGEITGISVDWLIGNVYIAQVYGGVGSILVCNGKNSCATLITRPNFKPASLVLHPHRGKMFWLSMSDVPKVEQSWMDGSYPQALLVMSPMSKPVSLTIDHVTEQLYWMDGELGVLETCRVDGTKRFSVSSHLPTLVYRLDVFESTVYLASQGESVVHRIPVYQQDAAHSSIKLSHVGPLKVVHKLKQPAGTNVCANKTCMFLCVRSPTGGRCICKDGFGSKTNTQCIGSLMETSVHATTTTGTECSLLCENGGVCLIDEDDIESCRCPQGYGGVFCQKLLTKASTTIDTECSLLCENGGLCLIDEDDIESCRCPEGYGGIFCQKLLTTGSDKKRSLAWTAGIIVPLTLLVVAAIAIFCLRQRRSNQNVIRTIWFGDPKFTLTKKDDEEEIVPELSFSNPEFPDEAFENSPNGDPDWWKKLLATSSVNNIHASNMRVGSKMTDKDAS
ncbi:putative vitellogenin receptor [Physella acuta]|uniref:putative vitellogenin receptor n=1 Tax=Physella acuta TaxID=109671 RepID=UPI0027DC2C43|nr:putative vitellogenin receptor [Physella acuta]